MHADGDRVNNNPQGYRQQPPKELLDGIAKWRKENGVAVAKPAVAAQAPTQNGGSL